MARNITVAAKATKAAPKAAIVKVATSKANVVAERKALAQSKKSEGMRNLLDLGYTVTQVQRVFDAPYGFVYGVALRHGVIDTAANRRAVKAAKVAKVVAKATKAATAKPLAKLTRPHVAVKATATRPSTATSATSRVAAKLAAKAAVKPGRPSAARRAANRKPVQTA